MRKLYILSGRTIAVVGYPLFFAYFRLFPSRRVRVLVVGNQGRILLLRGWLGFQKWSLPGGGCKKGESDQEAASRELLEETGIKITPDQFTFLGEYKNSDLGYITPLLVVKVKERTLKPLRGRAALEIIEYSWWETDMVPMRRSSLVDTALKYLSSGVG